ncbi:MAG: hypothetical protein U1A78_20880 [Polyangia bacterium]
MLNLSLRSVLAGAAGAVRRSSRTIGLGLLTAALLGAGACGDQPQFDLSQVAEVSGDGPLTWVRPSKENLECIKAPCPSYILHEVNTHATRFVYMMDWRALHLGEQEQQAVERGHSNLLLEGRLTDVTVLNEPAQIFQITRAHERVAEGAADRPDADRYYRLQIADHECMQPPCTGDWKATLLLMGAQPELWKSIDLSALKLPAGTEQTLLDELKTGQDYLSVSDVADLTAKATQAFRPIKSKQL